MLEKNTLDLSYFRKPKAAFIFMLIGVVFYQISNLLRPNYGNLGNLLNGKVLFYFKDLFAYYFCFEWVTAFLFLNGAYIFFKILKIQDFDPNPKGFLKINAWFLLYCVLAIVFIAPITNGVRYLFLQGQTYTWAEYYPEYFLTFKMYSRYFIPILFVGFGFLNHELFANYVDKIKTKGKSKISDIKDEIEKTKPKVITIKTQTGNSPIDVSEIEYIEKLDGKTCIKTINSTHYTQESMKMLLETFDYKHLVPINKSTSINIQKLDSYRFSDANKYLFLIADRQFEVRYEKVKELKMLKLIH
jgi:LytTr DNA-binding domain